jgi:hypothetical protein
MENKLKRATVALLFLAFFALDANAFLGLKGKGNGKASVKMGTYQYGNGAMLEVTGKAAKVLFEKLNFPAPLNPLKVDEDAPDVNLIEVPTSSQVTEHMEIRQSDSLQCIRTKKKYNCKIFIREDGTVGEIAPLYL